MKVYRVKATIYTYVADPQILDKRKFLRESAAEYLTDEVRTNGIDSKNVEVEEISSLEDIPRSERDCVPWGQRSNFTLAELRGTFSAKK